MLEEERTRLHPLPQQPYTMAFGQTRTVGWTTPVVDVDYCQYSAPYQLAGETVWVGEHGNDIVIVHIGADGPREVARHERTTPGKPQIDPTHLPPPPAGPLARRPKALTSDEVEFLAIGPGAERWLPRSASSSRLSVQPLLSRRP